MTLVQSEPKHIYYGEPIIVSDMQGPCPDGFHVPLSSEWQAVYDIWTALGGGSSDGTNFGIALKLPFAGHRYRGDSSVRNQGSRGYYWSSTRSNGNYAYSLYFLSSDINPQNYNSRSNAFSVRSFKDAPVTPTSSWTKLYGTSIEAGGIFWSNTDGLISLSNDGQTWITISDKNLGATTVWNSGDTLSETNCGGYFQWGNNYMFPFTGSVTTSSAQVDASTYGPGNYYNSSTFITHVERWDTTDNANLRGGVSQGTTEKPKEVKAVYLGTTKVRPPYKPRTFTITRTEQSDMSSGWTYSDDAAGLTAGDTAFDEFFGYYGCRLNTSGVETDTITQADSGGAGKLDITQLGTLTSGDNVMIAFPIRGIKMGKSGSNVTLSITDEPNKTGYQYYAFTKGNEIKDKLYLGAYKITSGYKSLSGASPLVNTTRANFRSGVKSAYDSSAGTDRYSQITWYPRNYINALYMMKYGNPNSQSVIGAGYTGGSAVVNTGGTNSQANATYGTSSNTQQAKLFGLEDRWGNAFEFLDGCWFNSSTQITVDKTNSVFQDSAYSTNLGAASSGRIGGIAGTNDGMFMNVNATGSGTTYYTDIFDAYANCTLLSGGARGNSTYAGAFNVSITYPYSVDQRYGSRLMYL